MFVISDVLVELAGFVYERCEVGHERVCLG
jgi:hypothetical protein